MCFWAQAAGLSKRYEQLSGAEGREKASRTELETRVKRAESEIQKLEGRLAAVESERESLSLQLKVETCSGCELDCYARKGFSGFGGD